MIDVFAELGRLYMNLSRRAAFVILIVLVVSTGACFAETDAETKKAELEKGLGPLVKEALTSEANLHGLAFPEDTSPRFVAKELQIMGNTLLPTEELLRKLPLAYNVSVQKGGTMVEETYDFRALHQIILNPGEECEVSLKTMQGLTKYILSAYQAKGYAGIYVYIPANSVESTEATPRLVDKVLIVEVLEGKVAKIEVNRYDFDHNKLEEGFLKESVLKSWSPVKEGEVIQKDKLDDFVRTLNLNPDRYISAVISRSADPDKLDLGYDVFEVNPWHWYIQADNAGTKDRQWSPRIGVINTNLLGFDDKLSVMYQAPWDKRIDDKYAVFGSYDFPLLTPRLRLNLYAGYSQFNVTPEGGLGINFLGNGSFYGGILSYNLFQINSWFVDITGSISHERSKITPSLGMASDVYFDLWGTGLRIHHSDDMSNTSLTFNRTESMGGSSREEFNAARLNATPDFTIYTTSVSHSQYLDPNKVNRLSGSFQLIVPDERLVPAKMTAFGGLYSVRGYKEDEIVADGGILASGQYEFDLVAAENRETKLSESPEEKPWLRKLAPLVFIDYGRASIKDAVPGEQKVQELCSVGAGTIIEIGNGLSGGIYYGWALISTDETDRGDGRLSLTFMYRF
jgi:hemolysin activation/secretion protein